MLTVTDLSVHYGRIQAVREVSLNVNDGEIVSLLGPNGAGKSSLLGAIVGLRAVSGGQVRWNEARLDNLPAHRITHQGVALVPEGRQLLSTLSVRDNLLLGSYARHAGRLWDLISPLGLLAARPEVAQHLERVYALFPRLRERQGQLAGSLSGGEQQMLAIGRALMAAPQLVLLDEPSVGLAPNLVREILALLACLRDQGLTILLVEQDAHAALRIADRGYVMETGRIVAEGTGRELLTSTRLQRAYLGMA